MANINQISLKVCGNPDANGGFQPMVIFNSPSIEIKDAFYTGFDANSYFFTIKIEQNQVVYKLIKNNVSSLGASRQGSLVIGIAIPKGYKLDVPSPYDVLMELKKGFITRCMTCKDPATDKYEFSTNRVQPNILDDIAGSYVLVPVQTPYRPMAVGAPIAYLTVTEDKIAQLMKDVQYPEFANFSEIVVAESVQNSNYVPISNITIPRMLKYSIYEDGVLQSRVVTDSNQELVFYGKGDTKFYENGSVKFTLQELLNGKNLPNVSIDRANEIINVSSKALQKPLTRKINVVFVPKEAETYFFTRRSDWNLIYGNQQIPLKDDLSFDLKGEQLKMLYAPQGFKVQQSRKDQYEAKVTSVSFNEIRITAEQVRNTSTISGGKTTTVVALPTSNLNACEIQLLLNHAYHRSPCRIQFYNSNNELLQSSTALFSRGTDGNYLATVLVPKSWTGGYVRICLKYKNEHWHSTNCLGRDSNGIIKLRDNDFKCKKIGFFCKHSKGITILSLMLLSLIVGGAIGGYITKKYFPTDGKFTYDKRYETHADLTNHEQNDHNENIETDNGYQNQQANDESTLPCDFCGEGSFNEADLAEHKLTCPKKVKCDKCDERFPSESDMNQHKKTVHPIEDYKCDSCGKTFTNSTELNKHIQNEHSVKTCDVCKEQFKDNKSLKKHKDQKHHFACDECGPDTWFKTKKELDVHKRGKDIHGKPHKR